MVGAMNGRREPARITVRQAEPRLNALDRPMPPSFEVVDQHGAIYARMPTRAEAIEWVQERRKQAGDRAFPDYFTTGHTTAQPDQRSAPRPPEVLTGHRHHRRA